MPTAILRATALACCVTLTLPTSSGASTPAAQTATAASPMTPAQWQEDLRFMAAEMERRHKNLYHTVSREAFAAAVADLHDSIPFLQRHEIIVGMMRIAALVGDGHTRVDPRKDAKFALPSLPLKLYLFDDGLFVRAADPEHAELVGAKIEAIGGVHVDEAIRRAEEISSRDNPMGPKLFVPLYLNMPHILHALKLSSTAEAAVLKLRKGKRSWTATVRAAGVEPIWPPDTDISLVTPQGWVDARRSPQPPIWLQEPLDYHRLIELPEHKAVYAQLNMVTNINGQTLGEFGKKIRQAAEASNPRAIILDLRLNQGGNGSLRNPFVRELIKAEDDDTRLFILTWRGTFSASQFILDDLDRLTNAVFIGEPASSKPSSYGDAYRMAMPNSGISVRSSLLWWQEGQNWAPWTYIDIATPFTFEAYAEGRDHALEAALTYTPRPPFHQQLAAAADSGVEQVLRLYQRYRSDPSNRYANIAQQTAHAAEQLYNAGHKEAGLALVELAGEHYPGHLDTFLVLAHLAEGMGRIDLARTAGRRALEINPNNRIARALMERLPPR